MAISSALPSLVMVDKDRYPIGNAYNLMDRRATVEVQWLKENVGEDRIFEVSKNRLDDHPALVNLLWEKNHRPEGFKRIRKALTIDGFITLRLTGRAACHYSGAAFYGVAYDLLGCRFNQEILDAIGIKRSLLPELYHCEEIVGEVRPAAAKATGLLKDFSVAKQYRVHRADGAGPEEAPDLYGILQPLQEPVRARAERLPHAGSTARQASRDRMRRSFALDSYM